MLMRSLYRSRTLLSSLTTTAIAAAATMSTSSPSNPPAQSSTSFPVRSYTPRHTSWPYAPNDFRRQDETDDTDFYSAPRFVTHIDNNAISVLGKYYAEALPRKGLILDFCSSWISHYPPEVERAVKSGDLQVVGMGMNDAELRRNKVLTGGRILQDLNRDPIIPATVGELDAATCVVSIDYLIKPVEVLKSLRQRMKEGGRVHLVISNRCFPTKAVGRWLRISEERRLEMVGDYLWFAGWRNIEILTLNDGKPEDGGGGALFGWFSSGTDPLWVVRGTKSGGATTKDEL